MPSQACGPQGSLFLVHSDVLGLEGLVPGLRLQQAYLSANRPVSSPTAGLGALLRRLP